MALINQQINQVLFRYIQGVMCLNVNRLFVIVFLLNSCSEKLVDYAWFEDDWISDAEASIEINPEYAELDSGELDTIRKMYGRITWTISGNTMTFRDDRYGQLVEFSSDFKVEPINAERFRMRMENESRLIWKTAIGFCTELESDFLQTAGIIGENVGLECFAPAGT